MGLDWYLVRCKCGHSFGHKKGNNAKCTICGSNEVTVVQQFSDSRSWRMPFLMQIFQKNSQKNCHQDSNPSLPLKKKESKVPLALEKGSGVTLRSATDEQGVLRINAIRRELDSAGLDAESWESIIGGAELEGILVRSSNDSWRWV